MLTPLFDRLHTDTKQVGSGLILLTVGALIFSVNQLDSDFARASPAVFSGAAFGSFAVLLVATGLWHRCAAAPLLPRFLLGSKAVSVFDLSMCVMCIQARRRVKTNRAVDRIACCVGHDEYWQSVLRVFLSRIAALHVTHILANWAFAVALRDRVGDVGMYCPATNFHARAALPGLACLILSRLTALCM